MLVLHIGPHKTATTYLQQNFAQQRAELLKRGWLYPASGVRTGVAHHDVAEARQEFVQGRGPAFETMRAAARKAKTGGLNVLLSAEGFRRWNARQVGALADVFEAPSPKLVYVLRDPMAVVRSMWAQSVKLGGTEELPRFLARHMLDPQRSRLLNPLRDLQLHLRRDRATFSILLYDELARRKVDIYSAFMSEALSVEGVEPVAGAVNSRPELEMTEFLRLISITGGYASVERRVDVGDAVRHLFSPEERRSITETIRTSGAGALRQLEVSRDTEYYDDIEQRLREKAAPYFRPDIGGGRLFPAGTETWTYYSSPALLKNAEIAALVRRASARLKRSGLRVAVMNGGFQVLMAGRRLRNLISARMS